MRRFMTFSLALSFLLSMSVAGYAQDRKTVAPQQTPDRAADRRPRDRETRIPSGQTGDIQNDKETRVPSGQKGDVPHDKETRQPNPNPVDIERNPQLKQKLASMLPPGTDLSEASRGFRNQGLFIATLHAAQNLNISFAQLKARLTGPEPRALGDAIHDLRPGIVLREAQKEAEKAQKQAQGTQKIQSKPTT
jgi:hypothetical protein